MAARGLTLNSILILRILTLLFCVVSIVLIVTNSFTLSNGKKTKFTDALAFRYILASGAVGLLYSLIQIPFAFYHACTQKRWIRDGYLNQFDFYGDKIVSLLLASGVGVGFGASFEVKRGINDTFDLIERLKFLLELEGEIVDFDVDEARSKSKNFLDRGILSSAILLGALTCMVALTLVTSKSRQR